MRCKECHATIPTPDDVHVLTTKCQYCGLDQPVPDAEQRRNHLLAKEREAAHARFLENREATRRAEIEQRNAEIEQRKKEHEWEKEQARQEKKERRRGDWSARLGTVITVIGALAAPVIVGITVFDLPARLGFGASGKDRLEQIQLQLASSGCSVVHAPDAEYASGPVSKLVDLKEGDCIRVFAAAGDASHRLALKVFNPMNAEVASQASTVDPQLLFCSSAAQKVRVQIDSTGKGRLSHMVLNCPAPPPPKPKPKGKPHKH